jgi:hypothetical protein
MTKNELSVIFVSPSNRKVVFPAEKVGRYIGLTSETYFLTFGNNEAKFVWKSKKFIVPEPTKAGYFQSDASLKNDIVGK